MQEITCPVSQRCVVLKRPTGRQLVSALSKRLRQDFLNRNGASTFKFELPGYTEHYQRWAFLRRKIFCGRFFCGKAAKTAKQIPGNLRFCGANFFAVKLEAGLVPKGATQAFDFRFSNAELELSPRKIASERENEPISRKMPIFRQLVALVVNFGQNRLFDS